MTTPYRDAADRLNDWNEIYDFKGVRKTIRTQAARYLYFLHTVRIISFNFKTSWSQYLFYFQIT